jgi:hypothetical protein
MHLKKSKCATVVVPNVSFSYPALSVRRSISFKLNQMSPVVMFVHINRFSKRKVGLFLAVAAIEPGACQYLICRQLAFRSKKCVIASC